MSRSSTERMVTSLRGDKQAPEDYADFLVGNNLDEIEISVMRATLKRCFGNKTAAAEILGVHPRTLSNKLEK